MAKSFDPLLYDFKLCTSVREIQTGWALGRRARGWGWITHLTTSSFALSGSFDDTGQVEQLNVGVLVLDDTRNTGQRSKLVSSCGTLGLSQGAQQCRLEQEEADT